jgi:hypothetical protein
LVKKARKAQLMTTSRKSRGNSADVGRELFEIAQYAQAKGWSAEELLRAEIQKREKELRKKEKTLVTA